MFGLHLDDKPYMRTAFGEVMNMEDYYPVYYSVSEVKLYVLLFFGVVQVILYCTFLHLYFGKFSRQFWLIVFVHSNRKENLPKRRSVFVYHDFSWLIFLKMELNLNFLCGK